MEGPFFSAAAAAADGFAAVFAAASWKGWSSGTAQGAGNVLGYLVAVRSRRSRNRGRAQRLLVEVWSVSKVFPLEDSVVEEKDYLGMADVLVEVSFLVAGQKDLAVEAS